MNKRRQTRPREGSGREKTGREAEAQNEPDKELTEKEKLGSVPR